MTAPPRIRAAAVGLLLLAVAALYVSMRYQAQIANLVAFLTKAQDEALGINWAKVHTERNLASTVPQLADELARAKKAGTKPMLGVRVTSGSTEFHLPDGPTVTSAGGPEAAGAAGLTPSSPPLLVSAEAQGAITGLADGSIRSTWKMFATVKQGDWTETLELKDVHADVAIDPALAKAWRTATAPPSYRIDAFIGASIGINGLGIVGQASGGRGRFGWFAAVDYVLADPTASRVAAGGRFTLKK